MKSTKFRFLSRAKMLGVLTKRINKINTSSQAPAKDLFSYTPNKLAAELHPKCQFLVVKKIREFSKDMKSFTFAPDVENGTKKLAWFSAGQYLSIGVAIDGKIYKRPYSIASSPQDTLNGEYMLTIKRVPGGIVSEYVLDNLKVGDKIIASAPLGNFTYERLRDAKNIIGIAGGSGITPFRSLAKSIYEGDEICTLTLLYGSRTKADAVFSNEIAMWARNSGRIKLVNVLSNEKASDCESGFITAELIQKYAPEGDFSIFMCGPQVLYDFADKEIAKLGIRRKFVRHELFGEYFHPEKNADYKGTIDEVYKLTVHIAGKTTVLDCKADTSLLRVMEDAGLNPPSDCRSGRCGWCRSQLLSGNVYTPASVDGRRQADKDFGYIHPCCAFPLSDVEIDVPPTPAY